MLQFRSINLKNEAKERAAASSPPPTHPPGSGPNETDPALDKKPDDDVVCILSVEWEVTRVSDIVSKGCVIPRPATRMFHVTYLRDNCAISLWSINVCGKQGWAKKVGSRFDEFCCCCSPLLPQLA